MTDYSLPEWHYLYGKPTATGQIRGAHEHFQVEEILPFVPDGEGENHMVHVEKRGLTTHQVAGMLAKFAGVPARDVSWAGLKDKHGVTRQWLSVRIPGKLEPKWTELNSDQLTILSASRNLKKLRTGALLGNRFKIAISGIDNPEALLTKVAELQAGVPNYYGEQRFGHSGGNVERALEMFGGKRIKDRNKRSIYLSAARSFLFNHVLSARLAKFGNVGLAGDALMLAGSNSYFIANEWDQLLLDRLASHDVSLSAPLWGDGEGIAQAEAGEFEAQIVSQWPEMCTGLANARLDHDRRRALLIPEQLQAKVEDGLLWLQFVLPAGAFATSLLRELVDYTDAQQLQFEKERQ
ncbi:tRNA pseudouridine(13) synthase TruD [Ferrimonas senticii]|uniref:tRNA pseudouridine(13) synthase TruD n=1 Tax=Ferrimonas senticii TaxID=394566 RepID=UPI00040243C0|nr:tRNA pseudouridine(13) synthase TruD [Ferrimonas senticii]